ncbi:MAG TPA: hypothetical protein VNO55_12470 [Polyangia bacterium]|nr:hypothetical protein [Polyangia bacterium]
MRAARVATAFFSVVLVPGSAFAAGTVVQVPIDQLLNGRSVSTLTGGVVVPWTDGVDQTDGLVTNAAEAFLKQTGVALPDDGVFPADGDHPQVVLHFSNTSPIERKQVFYLHGTGTFHFATPRGTYSKLWVFLLSSIGASPLTVTYAYDDGGMTQEKFTVPDWGTGAPLPRTPPIFFNLIAGMHKWDQMDRSIDAPVHTITGVLLSPAADRVLTDVQIDKPNAGQFLTFWGATGLASLIDSADGGPIAPVDAGMDADPVIPVEAPADGAADVPSTSDARDMPADEPPVSSPDAKDVSPSDVGSGNAHGASSGCSLTTRQGNDSSSGRFILFVAALAARRRRARRDRAPERQTVHCRR